MFFFTTYVWKMGFIAPDPIVNETFFFFSLKLNIYWDTYVIIVNCNQWFNKKM